VPSGLLSLRAGAGRRGKENRKTGKNGVFRRRFEKTSGYTGRNYVRRTRPEATDASARSAWIGARRAKSEVRKTDGKSRKPDDSGATFGTSDRPVAVDVELRNSAVGRGDSSATRSKNFVPIGRAVRTPGSSARDLPSGEAAKRPIDAGGPSSNASPAGHGRAKLAAARRATRRRNRTKKNRENRRRRSKVIDDSASVKMRVRSKTFARRLRRPRSAASDPSAVVAADGGGFGAVGRASDRGAGGDRFDSGDRLFFFCSRGVRRKRNLANGSTITRSRRRPSLRVQCIRLNTRLAARYGKAVLQRLAVIGRRRRREKSNRK
jgi:hypothetical protein